MWKNPLGACLVVLFLLTPALADQVVSVAPLKNGEKEEAVLNRAFDQAIALEMDDILGSALPGDRRRKIMTILAAERNTIVRGYSAAPGAEDAANASDAENASEAVHPETLTVNVRIQREELRARLREMGILATVRAPLPYVLLLENVEPSRTARLGFLQDVSGLHPVGAAGAEVPVLRLTQFGDWRGTLSLGPWNATRESRSLDDVWFFLWKEYFTRPGSLTQQDLGLGVRISGWASSDGPMEFDRLMDRWNAEIDQKTLTGMEMHGGGMAAVWRIRPRSDSKDALLTRLKDAARAQGLRLEIF